MENTQENRYVKRTQKDYTMSFKLQIVQEIEQGKLTLYSSNKEVRYSMSNNSCRVAYENLVTLIGKIKHHPICQNHQNKK